MSNSNSSKQILLSAIGIAILVIAVVGVTYAFFNYTRTGASNTIKVGKIAFNSRQDGVINLTNVFPIDKNNVDSDTDNVGSVTINITGDTTYSDGIEYLVTAVNINNSIGTGNNQKQVPISVSVSYEENENKTIGESDKDYFDNRGGNTSLYKVLAGKQIDEGNKIVVGYIAPGQTGIDGNINIKAYIDKDNIAISDTYPSGAHSETIGEDTYDINPNATSSDIENCSNYLLNRGISLLDGESYENFCNGTGTLMGMSLSQMISRGIMLEDFLNLNVIIQTGYAITNTWTDGTTNEWVNGRMVFTTEEWNSLQQDGISFQVKVEANEGIWVPEQGNAMNKLPTFITDDYSTRISITEIYFDDFSENELNSRYNQATIKADITYNNEGNVKLWLEPDINDNTKNIMYIASDGETFLTTGEYLFSYFSNLEKIEFNNVNTSRVNSMRNMFYHLDNLKSLDVTSFDTGNVTNMSRFMYDCPKVESVNMHGLDLRKTQYMDLSFFGITALTEIDLGEIQMRDIVSMNNMFHYTDNLEYINLDGLGGDNLETIGRLFRVSSKIKNISMENFNFGKITDLSSFFSDYSTLEEINISNIIISNVNNISSCFAGDIMLKKIYVSNSNIMNTISNGSNMFYNCTSLVGGNGTTFNSTKIDQSMAVIDALGTPGYLTLKTN